MFAVPEPLMYSEKFGLYQGEVYVVEEPRPELFFDIFTEAVIQGIRTLLLTREFPERVRRSYNPQGATVLWLTNVLGKDRIQPTKLGVILNKIITFPDDKPSLIMLDGIEYLINQNGFDAIVSLINNARDQVIIKNSVMVVSMDPDTMDLKERALLERNMQLIRNEAGSGTVLSLEAGVVKVKKMPGHGI
ncbi:MAG: DUF835 domain-containing protein [Methanomassiliicoccales archaeon]